MRADDTAVALLAGDWSVVAVDRYDIGLLLTAVVVLAAAILPRLMVRTWITAPFVFMLGGFCVFLLPLDWQLPDLVDDPRWAERLTELGVIIALTSAGLKLEAPFAWSTWRISWRLLAITMPLTIALTALLGWWALGLVPATAILFGAVIAPTDPVLASDVQTTPPQADDRSSIRLALTTEAGLNDGLAFPFTNLAIALALGGLAPAGWLADWLLIDVAWKIVVGTAVGYAAGVLLALLVFRIPASESLARTMTGIIAVSLTLLPYALAEVVSSYGFIAVFVAACAFRQKEKDHRVQSVMHDFSEELERVLVAILMFLIGAYVATGALAPVDWPMVVVALLTLFVIRPLAGMIGLVGTDLPLPKRSAIAFFGIRGIGSLYYLAYAVHHASFPNADALWALILLIVVGSVVVHGLTARAAMHLLDRQHESG